MAHKVVCITTVDLSLRYLLLNHLRHLKTLGYDVIAISSPGPYLGEVETAGIRVIPVPMTRRITPLQDIKALLRLTAVLRREKPAIVHTHTPKANLLGQWAARLAGIPVRVSTVHGLYFTVDTSMPKRFLFQMIEAASALFAHTIFMINREDIDTARRLRVCDPTKLRLLPGGLGINLERFDRDKTTQDTLLRKRAEFGFEPSNKIVGFVGRLVAEKGVIELFRAARIVLEQVPEARFLFVGPIDYEKPDAVTPDTAERYGVRNKCAFAGMRRDTADLYSQCQLESNINVS